MWFFWKNAPSLPQWPAAETNRVPHPVHRPLDIADLLPPHGDNCVEERWWACISSPHPKWCDEPRRSRRPVERSTWPPRLPPRSAKREPTAAPATFGKRDPGQSPSIMLQPQPESSGEQLQRCVELCSTLLFLLVVLEIVQIHCFLIADSSGKVQGGMVAVCWLNSI